MSGIIQSFRKSNKNSNYLYNFLLSNFFRRRVVLGFFCPHTFPFLAIPVPLEPQITGNPRKCTCWNSSICDTRMPKTAIGFDFTGCWKSLPFKTIWLNCFIRVSVDIYCPRSTIQKKNRGSCIVNLRVQKSKISILFVIKSDFQIHVFPLLLA